MILQEYPYNGQIAIDKTMSHRSIILPMDKSLSYPLDIENSIYTITSLQGITATADSRRANAPLATSEASPVTFNGGATSTRLFR